MAKDLMRYDQLAQNALRGVVREALRVVQRSGLPGEHHFYIAFSTRHPGVSISEKLLQRYPREMTIVLQHQYGDLVITEDHFEVVLYFDQVAERLLVPFSSIKGFLDPAVQFGLQFEVMQAETGLTDAPAPEAVPDAKPGTPDAEKPEPPIGEKVVSLDAFRKK
jgi:uncharacterized protein